MSRIAVYAVVLSMAFATGALSAQVESVAKVEAAAEAGEPSAQCQMGLFYMNVLGVDLDEEKAVEWLNEAAKQDYVDAQFNLAKLYLNPHHPASRAAGAGRRAISLLRLAAAQNHKGAKSMLEELGAEQGQ